MCPCEANSAFGFYYTNSWFKTIFSFKYLILPRLTIKNKSCQVVRRWVLKVGGRDALLHPHCACVSGPLHFRCRVGFHPVAITGCLAAHCWGALALPSVLGGYNDSESAVHTQVEASVRAVFSFLMDTFLQGLPMVHTARHCQIVFPQWGSKFISTCWGRF